MRKKNYRYSFSPKKIKNVLRAAMVVASISTVMLTVLAQDEGPPVPLGGGSETDYNTGIPTGADYQMNKTSGSGTDNSLSGSEDIPDGEINIFDISTISDHWSSEDTKEESNPPPPFPLSPDPTWPTAWIKTDDDPDEGGQNDYRDVNTTYYNWDSEYLYLRMYCFGTPDLATYDDTRYKWFIDLDCDISLTGGTMSGQEYILFVENADDDIAGVGEVYFLNDVNGDGLINDDWGGGGHPYRTNPGEVTNSSVVGYRITGNNVDLYVRLANITDPLPDTLCFSWDTDQENPNLDQAPNVDRPDTIPIGPFPVPEFSDIIIPIIGMIALFAIFRKLKKK